MNKIKLRNTTEFKIKLVISVTFFVLLILSFFFASPLESLLGLKPAKSKNLTSYESLFSSNYLVEYIDVGQGNSTLISLPDGKTMLIDGGDTSYSETVSNFIKSRGIKTIDYMVATHADTDHIGGLVYVLENFEVKNIYRPFQIAGTGSSAEDFEIYADEDLAEVYTYLNEKYNGRSKISRVTSNTYKNFISRIYSETYTESEVARASEVTVFYDGLKISGDGYQFEFYAPFVSEDNLSLQDYSNTNGYATVGYGAGESNGNSAIFTLSINSKTFLFTGDAPFTKSGNNSVTDSGFEEIDFVNSLSLAEVQKLKNVSVYLVGHHGSEYSSGSSLLQLITPQFCVISVAKFNSYGHPADAVVNRLNYYKSTKEDILLTSKLGNITFGEIDGTLMFATTLDFYDSKTSISWYLLGTIIFACAQILVISVRPFSSKTQSC